MRTPLPAGALALLVSSWDRVRASPVRKGLFLYAVAALVVCGAAFLPDPEASPLGDAERFAFDQQMRALRAIHPRPIVDDVVLIGTNEDTYRLYDEPFALWHRHFAEVMHALARAKPRAVGMDFVLPEKSYNNIIDGIDMAMMRGLYDLNRATRLVYVQTVDSHGNILPVQPNYRNIIRDENLGIDQHRQDPDGVSRAFGGLTDGRGREIPTLAGQVVKAIGRTPGEGFIDYSLGMPLRYYPMHEVGRMSDAALQQAFGGRIVLVGSLVGFVDRWRLPTRLLAVDPGRKTDPYIQPGVLVHAQSIRSLMGPGLLRPLGSGATLAFVALALLAVFRRGKPFAVIALAIAIPATLLAASLTAIVGAQLLLPLATLTAAFWIALVVRGLFDASEAVVERVRLHRSFAGQVSPAVMQEMLGGTLTPGINGQLADVCVLFSDVRDFTTLSEKMSPQVVTTVLQRYFDGMVKAVHRYDGTVDKFIGDGMMVLFGAPLKLADPCGQAVQCALAMMAALDALNEEFRAEGLPQLVIGIGINYGTVTVGNIGSSERHNYSAIGDAVNVAARLEGLTKGLGRKILITETVVERLGGRFQFEPLGSHNVKGHSPVSVWGIRTRPVEAATVPAAAAVA